MKRFAIAFTAVALAAGLAACGGSSDFKAKAQAECEKDPSSKDVIDCSCAAGIMDKELDDKTKTAMLKADELKASGKSEDEAMKEAGLDGADMLQKLMPTMQKVAEQCMKKK